MRAKLDTEGAMDQPVANELPLPSKAIMIHANPSHAPTPLLNASLGLKPFSHPLTPQKLQAPSLKELLGPTRHASLSAVRTRRVPDSCSATLPGRTARQCFVAFPGSRIGTWLRDRTRAFRNSPTELHSPTMARAPGPLFWLQAICLLCLSGAFVDAFSWGGSRGMSVGVLRPDSQC